MVGRLERRQKRRQAGIGHLETVEQLGLDPPVDRADDAGLGALAKKQAEHHRGRSRERDGRGVEGRAHFCHDGRKLVADFAGRLTAERGAEMHHGSQEAEHRRDPANEANQTEVGLRVVVILVGEAVQEIGKPVGGSPLLQSALAQRTAGVPAATLAASAACAAGVHNRSRLRRLARAPCAPAASLAQGQRSRGNVSTRNTASLKPR